MEGGINAGSVISFIQHINATEIDSTTGVPLCDKQTTSMEVKMANPEEIGLVDGDIEAPAIILANTGQLRWCRSLGKAMTFTSWNALTRPSAVDECIHYDHSRNSVSGHRDISQHVDQILTTVIPKLCGKYAKIEIVAIADSCEYVPISMDRNWSIIAPRMQSLALINPNFSQQESYTSPLFKAFLRQRTRGFIKDSTVPANTPMFGPSGGVHAWQNGLGYNVYSIPDESADESIFPRHFLSVLEWQGKVATGGKEYVEDEMEMMAIGDEGESLGDEIDTTVKTVAEIEAEIRSGLEEGLLTADIWNTADGVGEIPRKGDELTKVKKAMTKGFILERAPRAGEGRIMSEGEEVVKESRGIMEGKQRAPAGETETKTRAYAEDRKAVALEIAKEVFKEHDMAQHSTTEPNSSQNNNLDAISGTTAPHIRTQTQAVPSNNDATLEAIQQDLTNDMKMDLINLLAKPVDPEEAKASVAEEATELQEDVKVTAPTEQKKSIFEEQGFIYHEMSTEEKELGFTRFKWLTDEEAVAAEKELADTEKARKKAKADEKKTRADRLNKAEKKALLNAQIEPRKLEVFREDGLEEISTKGAALPPAVEEATEICSRTSVEDATKGLVAHLKILDIASHTALPATPKKALKVVKATAMDDISDDEEEFVPRQPKLEKHVSFKDVDPYKIATNNDKNPRKSFDGANDGVADDNVSHDTMDYTIAAGKSGISFETAVQKKLAANNARQFQKSLKATIVEPPVSPVSPFVSKTAHQGGLRNTTYAKLFDEEKKKPLFSLGGDEVTDEDAYLSCPPERMERLPSAVAKTLHTGSPVAKLSKAEKAAILQTTILSSPVKGNKGQGEDYKISVVTLNNHGGGRRALSAWKRSFGRARMILAEMFRVERR